MGARHAHECHAFARLEAKAEQARGPLALDIAPAAVLLVREDVNALSTAIRAASRAACAALTALAGSRPVGDDRAHLTTRSAVVDVAARIDAARSAIDERSLALKITFARLTRRRGVRGRHAYRAATAAVGGVGIAVNAGRAAGGFVAGYSARPLLADLSSGARRAARTTVLSIGQRVDALVRTLRVARIAAANDAGTVAARHAAVGGRRARRAALSAIFRV